MMHLSEKDHESVARVKEVISAEAARCNSQLGTVWEGVLVSLDRRLPREAEVVELRLLHGGEIAHDEHCVRCGRSAPAHESDEYLYWESDGGDGMICPACLTTEERQRVDEDVLGASRASDVFQRQRGE